MAKNLKADIGSPALNSDYLDAIVASGLVDDITEIAPLEPRPFRYAEGEFLCRRGDAAEGLWIIVSGSVAVKDRDRTLFTRRRNEIVGEQNLLGNGYRRLFDLVAAEATVEVLVIDKERLEAHPQCETIWRNIARIVSLKLKSASAKVASLSRQLEDDTRILHAYTNEYALSRRLQSGSGRLTEYRVDRAVIWFSDIAEFSQHTLTMAPDRIADIVQRFFNAQSAPIAGHGGHIDKFIGDGLMAFWVVKESGKAGRSCLNALRAAENAIDEVAEIRIGDKPLRLRIGLHIGYVLSGDFGSATRHQFTIIGPEVNKAARLEEIHDIDVIDGINTIGDIRLSREFHHELGSAVQRRYGVRCVARAKNIGELEIYSHVGGASGLRT
ncbi:MAG TPA: adenylate/guanylate cyclase domain-containing protein [Afifellaceae bacterium]|nr:adenylate/guanylate cyclase domain-containing protein [Afifellaceae bacterium]